MANTQSVQYNDPSQGQAPDWARFLSGMVQGGAGQITMQQKQQQEDEDFNRKAMLQLMVAHAQQNSNPIPGQDIRGPFQNMQFTPPPTDWGSMKNQQEALKLQNENQNPMDFVKRDAAKAQLTQLGNPLTWKDGQPPTQEQYLQIMANINAMMSGQGAPEQGAPTVTPNSSWNPFAGKTTTPGAVTRPILDKKTGAVVRQTLTAKGWVNPDGTTAEKGNDEASQKRQKAVKVLQNAGKPVTEANIKYISEQM